MTKRAKPTYSEGYGIVNPWGQFWSTDLYPDEEAAKAAFRRFWRDAKDAPAWDQYRAVPARLRIQEASHG